jgi:hypothetical protein
MGMGSTGPNELLIMGIIAAYRQYRQSLKDARRKAAIRRLLIDDPLTTEEITAICREYNFHWEITQKDGTVVRFYKNGFDAMPRGGAAW